MLRVFSENSPLIESDKKLFKPAGNFPIYADQQLHFSAKKYSTVTLFSDFEIKSDELNRLVDPVLFLPHIGENWEIFLNGNLLQKEIYLNNNKIETYRAVEGIELPINREFIKSGNNLPYA